MRDVDNEQVTFDFGSEDTDEAEVLDTPDEIQQGLDEMGFEADGRHDPREAEPEATEFGADDRALVDGQGDSEQGELFFDVEKDQRTLDGESAAQCKWE